MSELFAAPAVSRDRRADGSVLLTSAVPLGSYPANVAAWLRHWAGADPDHPLVAERDAGGSWDIRTYGQALLAANAIGQALLDRGLSAASPLLIISGNSVNHLLMTLGAFTAGVPVAPVSAAYSLQSRDHQQLRAIAALVRPGAVYADDAQLFGAALAALGAGAGAPGAGVPGAGAGTPLVLAGSRGPPEHSLQALLGTEPGAGVAAAFAAAGGDSVAKILFTSGSTGQPKGVLNTQRMLCANQQMIRQAWPFLGRQRPVLVDWLPWSHTFGGNHNVNMVLANGGTLYIDEGRPAPGLLAATLANYRDVSPTMSFNVPAGYAQLAPALEADRELATRFFGRLQIVFNAAAALPPALRRRLETLAREVTGRDVPVTGAWGATETAPAATSAHFAYRDSRCIGTPLPGVTVKLVPATADGYEIRVRGPHVTPGYLRRPDLTAASFDDEGFYRAGDAVSFADPGDPAAGLLFRGRLAEDFKLSTGTFVRVGALRTALLSAAPVLLDAVIAGEDHAEVGALAWLNAAEAGSLLAAAGQGDGPVLHSPQLHRHLGPVLARFNSGAGSAARITRLLVLARPPSLDDGEITDKGYLNQRQVLASRAGLVRLLYTDPPSGKVVTPASGTPGPRGGFGGRRGGEQAEPDDDERLRRDRPPHWDAS